MTETYKLSTGDILDLSGLTGEEHVYLEELSKDAKDRAEYFELLRRVKGPGALPLRGGPITPSVATSVIYRVAHDIVDRVGIDQGYLLAPELAGTEITLGTLDLLSMTEAAELIGISRPATHQALKEERLRGQRVGNAWVVARSDAEAFRDARNRGTRRRETGDLAVGSGS